MKVKEALQGPGELSGFGWNIWTIYDCETTGLHPTLMFRNLPWGWMRKYWVPHLQDLLRRHNSAQPLSLLSSWNVALGTEVIVLTKLSPSPECCRAGEAKEGVALLRQFSSPSVHPVQAFPRWVVFPSPPAGFTIQGPRGKSFPSPRHELSLPWGFY